MCKLAVSMLRIFEKDSRLASAISVAYFAIAGCGVRVAIMLLLYRLDFGITTTVPNKLPGDPQGCKMPSAAHGYFVQNILGCIIMAVVARHKKSMNVHLANGLASGFCGSLTTWATWMSNEANTILNGHTWQAFVSMLSMLCVSLCSYRFGHFMAGCGMGDEPRCFDKHCGLFTLTSCIKQVGKRGDDRQMDQDIKEERDMHENRGGSSARISAESSIREATTDEETGQDEAATSEPRPNLSSSDWSLFVDGPETWSEPEPPDDVVLSSGVHIAIVLLCFVGIAVYCSMAGALQHWELLFNVAMAPAGALLRWWLSLFNKYTAPFPLFTLIANTLGCVCIGFASVLHMNMASGVGADAVAAVGTGFAGSLSTVSTLVGELRSDSIGKLRMRIFYFVMSLGLAMGVLLPLDTVACY